MNAAASGAGAANPAYALFRLRTAHGTEVLVDGATGRLFHGPVMREGAFPVVACIPASRPDVCLLAADGKPLVLGIWGDGEAERVVSLRIRPVGDGAHALSEPIGNVPLLADPLVDGAGRLFIDRDPPNGRERFEFAPAPEVGVLARVLLETTLSFLPALESTRATLAAIHAAAPTGEIRPVLRLMRPGELDRLGRLLLHDLSACRAVAVLYPDNLWARLGLTALAAAEAERGALPGAARPGFVRTIEPALDILAVPNILGEWRGVPHALNSFARREREPGRTLCLLTTLRDEGPYLLEWVAFHRALGVEGIFVYSNDNSDGSDELLHALAAAGIVNWTTTVAGPGVSPQYKAYGHALQLMPEILDFRWAGFIDMDEYVVPDHALYGSIPAFLAARDTEEVDCVVLNWLQFGSNGHTRRSEASLVERFITREAAVNPHVKAFFKPHRFIHAMPHHPFPDRTVRSVFRAADGALHPRDAVSPAPQDAHAFVAHFHTKSAEETLLRRSMSRADVMLGTDVSPARFPSRSAEMFVEQHRAGGVPDGRAAPYVAGMKQEADRLRALPGVEAALVLIERRYRDRLASMRGMVRDDPRFQRPGTAERWFAEALDAVAPAVEPA